jgi:hypothetical protein
MLLWSYLSKLKSKFIKIKPQGKKMKKRSSTCTLIKLMQTTDKEKYSKKRGGKLIIQRETNTKI